MTWDFDSSDLFEQLENADDLMLDTAPFGVVAMAVDGVVSSYNRFESRLSGLPPEKVIGRRFFTAVAPCTNNFMVAHRYESEDTLDATLDYVFTFKMKPTSVRLRLLKSPKSRRMYLVVQRI